MNTRIYSIIFLVIALGLAVYLVNSIKSAIDSQAAIKDSEAAVIEKLKLIRESEKTYQEVYGSYTNNWDTLINFIEHGKYPILDKKEFVQELSYGADTVIVKIDTVDIIPAKQQIFEDKHDVYAASDGVFKKFFVSVGSKVVKGQKIYSMVNALNGKVVNQIAKNKGVVTKLGSIADGDQLKKGQTLFSMLEEKFDPDTDISKLAYIPMTDPPKKFDLFADRIEKNRIMVDVIEVRDIASINPKRSEKNEANNRKPLRFGSRTEVTTAGNWE